MNSCVRVFQKFGQASFLITKINLENDPSHVFGGFGKITWNSHASGSSPVGLPADYIGLYLKNSFGPWHSLSQAHSVERCVA